MIVHYIKRLFSLLRPSNNTSNKTPNNSLSFHVGTHVGRMLDACGAHESGGGRDEKEKSKSE